MARAESMALFEELGRQGMHLFISSHILDEVDRISDRVVLITGGYLIAEGNIHRSARKCAKSRCRSSFAATSPELLASKMFAINHCVEARLHADGKGVFLRTGDIDQFYSMLNGIAAEGAGQDRCRRAGRRRCQCDLPIPDRLRWECARDATDNASLRDTLAQQPWGLWWMQARRLTRIEVRRNLFSWRASWIYFLAFIPTAIILIHALVRLPPSVRNERRHRGPGRHHSALLHPPGGFLRLPRDFLRA